MSKNKVSFDVSFIRPEGATGLRAREYVIYALAEMRGALQPPGRDGGGENPDEPGDPMFSLDTDTIKVTEKRKRPAQGFELVEAFDTTAQVWGCQSDQGHGKAVKRAELDYNEARRKLLAYIQRLERRA